MSHPLIEEQITFLYTHDLQETARFYEQTLGFDLKLDQGMCKIYSVTKDSFLGFCQKEGVDKDHPDVIFTLVTHNVDDWFEFLQQQDVNIEKPPTINEKFNIPVLTDIHSADEAGLAAQYVDVLQIPAFLCRQTELLVAAAKTGKAINIKKGQFMSPESMKFAADKVLLSGNNKVMLTERGTMFGYQDLIIDYRGIIEMKKLNLPVVLDVTHSLQQTNQSTGVSGGNPELVETIARAGIAIGVDGIFMETHPEPSIAKSDGLNMIKMAEVETLLTRLVKIRGCINEFE